MVKCWNCEHLMIAYSGELVSERLFATELRKCKVKGVVFERHSDITEERECEDYKEAKNKIGYEEVEALRKEIFMYG